METYINFWFYETQRRDRVSQLLYHMCKQNWQARRKSRKDQTSMRQSNTGHKKKRTKQKKKLKLPFRSICPSPFKSAVLMISLTSSSVNWLWRFIIVHLNSSALINPLSFHVRHWTFLVSLLLCLFLSSGIHRWRNSQKSMMPLPWKKM